MPIHTGYIDGFVSHARGNGGERETHVDQKGDVRVPQIMDADSLYTSSFRTALHFAGQEVFGEGEDSLVRFRLVERLDVIPHFVADVLRHLNGSIALFRLGRRDVRFKRVYVLLTDTVPFSKSKSEGVSANSSPSRSPHQYSISNA